MYRVCTRHRLADHASWRVHLSLPAMQHACVRGRTKRRAMRWLCAEAVAAVPRAHLTAADAAHEAAHRSWPCLPAARARDGIRRQVARAGLALSRAKHGRGHCQV